MKYLYNECYAEFKSEKLKSVKVGAIFAKKLISESLLYTYFAALSYILRHMKNVCFFFCYSRYKLALPSFWKAALCPSISYNAEPVFKTLDNGFSTAKLCFSANPLRCYIHLIATSWNFYATKRKPLVCIMQMWCNGWSFKSRSSLPLFPSVGVSLFSAILYLSFMQCLLMTVAVERSWTLCKQVRWYK